MLHRIARALDGFGRLRGAGHARALLSRAQALGQRLRIARVGLLGGARGVGARGGGPGRAVEGAQRVLGRRARFELGSLGFCFGRALRFGLSGRLRRVRARPGVVPGPVGALRAAQRCLDLLGGLCRRGRCLAQRLCASARLGAALCGHLAGEPGLGCERLRRRLRGLRRRGARLGRARRSERVRRAAQRLRRALFPGVPFDAGAALRSLRRRIEGRQRLRQRRLCAGGLCIGLLRRARGVFEGLCGAGALRRTPLQSAGFEQRRAQGLEAQQHVRVHCLQRLFRLQRLCFELREALRERLALLRALLARPLLRARQELALLFGERAQRLGQLALLFGARALGERARVFAQVALFVREPLELALQLRELLQVLLEVLEAAPVHQDVQQPRQAADEQQLLLERRERPPAADVLLGEVHQLVQGLAPGVGAACVEVREPLAQELRRVAAPLGIEARRHLRDALAQPEELPLDELLLLREQRALAALVTARLGGEARREERGREHSAAQEPAQRSTLRGHAFGHVTAAMHGVVHGVTQFLPESSRVRCSRLR